MATIAVVPGAATTESIYVVDPDGNGIEVAQAWGMTETSPLASVANPPPGLSEEEEWSYRDSQGRLFCTVEGRLVGDDGAVLSSSGGGGSAAAAAAGAGAAA